MTNLGADRNLLFGILALQMDFITREQLIASLHAWVLEKETPLGRVLMGRGELSSDRFELLEALVAEHLRQHAGDPEKSLRALSSLGSVREEIGQLGDNEVDASLDRVAADQQEDDSTLSSSIGPATSIGRRFRILRPHASGGLARVSVASDEELHREVALKELQQQFADDPHSRARFVLEAEITGSLEHPGIVPVYGLGQYADGRPYYAMRFVRGDNLKEAIERFHNAEASRRIPTPSFELRKLLGRFIDVCNAVEYAHSRGVLHRDLKPGNIMLGNYGETLVVDWGLAKPTGRPESERLTDEGPLAPDAASGSAPTRLGTTIGTPSYMSPEQAAGRLEALGPVSDVYSLGATLYSLLTGRAPIVDTDVGAILAKARHADFPRPSSIKAGVPAALEAICLKAMALAPEDRYGTPAELAEDIEHWLGDEPVLAHREPLVARAARWGRRHKTSAASLGVLLCSAVVGLSIGAVLLGRANRSLEQQRDMTLRHATEAERQRDRANTGAAEAALQRDLARKATADAYQGRGLSSLQQGRHLQGIHWLVRSLEAAPHEDGDMQRVSRLNLATWSSQFLPIVSDQPVPRFLDVETSKGGFPFALRMAAKIGSDFAPPPGITDPTDVAFAKVNELENRAALQLFDRETLQFTGPPIRPDGYWLDVTLDREERILLTSEWDGEWFTGWTGPQDPDSVPDEVRRALDRSGGFGHVFQGTVTLKRHMLDDLDGSLESLRLEGVFVWDSPYETLKPRIFCSPEHDTVLYHDFNSNTASLWSFWRGERFQEPVSCVNATMCPNFRYWAAVDSDNTVTVRSVGSGSVIGVPLHHDAKISAFAFNHHGTLLGTATEDGLATVWAAQFGTRKAVIRHELEPIQSIAVSSLDDGLCLVSDRGEVQLWRHTPSSRSSDHGANETSHPYGGSLVHTARLQGAPHGARFNDNESWLIIEHALPGKEIWNPKRQASERLVYSSSRDAADHYYSAPVFDEIRRLVADVDDRGDVRLFNDDRTIVLPHESPAVQCLLSGDGTRLATVDEIGVVRLWETRTGEVVGVTHNALPGGDRVLAGVSDSGNRVAALESSATRAFGQMYGQVRMITWELNLPTTKRADAVRTPVPPAPMVPAAPSGAGADSQGLRPPAPVVPDLAPSGNARPVEWPPSQSPIDPALLTSGRAYFVSGGRASFAMHPMRHAVIVGASGPVAISSDGAMMACVDRQSKLHVFATTTGRRIGSVFSPAVSTQHLPVAGLEFTHEKKQLVVVQRVNSYGGGPLQAQLWDVQRGAALGPVVIVQSATGATALSPNGARIAIGETYSMYDPQEEFESQPIHFRVWDLTTGEARGPEFVHHGDVTALAFSADGRLLASGSVDQTARVWDVATGTPLIDRLQHDGSVEHLFFVEQGERLLTVSETAWQTWDASSGLALLPAIRLPALCVSAAVSPDGSRIVTACGNPEESSTIQEWDIDTGRPIGPLRRAPGPSDSIAYDRFSTSLVVGGADLFIWPAARSMTGSAAAIRVWAESATGVAMDDLGGLKSLAFDGTEQRRNQLAESKGVAVQEVRPLEVWHIERLLRVPSAD